MPTMCKNFIVKCGATPEASSSASLGEPSTPFVCDTKDTKIQGVWQHIEILSQNLPKGKSNTKLKFYGL